MQCLMPEEFIKLVKENLITKASFSNYKIGKVDSGQLKDGPPCLQTLCSQGFGEGCETIYV